jgi:serine/threonine-protein kinase PknG
MKPDSKSYTDSASSLLFKAPTVTDADLDWRDLPLLRPDEHDAMEGWLHALGTEDPDERLALLANAPQQTPEVQLATARSGLEAGRPAALEGAVNALLADDPWEWRAVWMSGLAALAAGDAKNAQASFNAVYGQVPGELAPKLALALACEASGELDVAEGLYTTCSRTDGNFVAPAAFGLARVRSNRGDVDGAVAALDLVPRTSGAYVTARRHRASILATSGGGLPALAAAMSSVEAITIDPVDRATLSVDVYGAALREVLANGPRTDVHIGGHPATEQPLRSGLEAAYRELAGHTPDRAERIRLVDLANGVRGWTFR